MWKIVTVTLVSLVLLHYSPLIWHLGFHKSVYNHAPGNCRFVGGIAHGSEDIQVLDNGLAFITSGLDIPVATTSPIFPRNGSIALFDFNKPNKGVRHLDVRSNYISREQFDPHGISLWREPSTGKVYVFVVNHYRRNTDAVEKFLFVESSLSLEHIQTYTSDVFGQVNDVVATSADSFYFTNYHYVRRGNVELYLYLKLGNVGYHDGKTARTVASGFVMPNGINISPDGRFVYLAESEPGYVHLYNRQTDNSLKLNQSIFTGSAIDNIDVNLETGHLWIGSHPVAWKTFRYLDGPMKYESPSQVLKVAVKDDGATMTQVTEVYSNDGSQLSGSTIAVEFKGRMLVGTVHTELLLCDVHYA